MPLSSVWLEYVEKSGAGFLLEKEVNALSKLVDDAPKPFVAVVGGAKVSDKLGVLNALLKKADVLVLAVPWLTHS